MNLKDRKKPTEHRQGTLIKLVDTIQRFTEIQHEDEFWMFDKEDRFDEGHMNPKYVDEIQDIMRELQLFDITEIGDLYLTSGDRIVLDQGYGESFGTGDQVIFTLKELTAGMDYEFFMKKLKKMAPKD